MQMIKTSNRVLKECTVSLYIKLQTAMTELGCMSTYICVHKYESCKNISCYREKTFSQITLTL